MLGTVACDKILKIICGWNALRLSSSEEVLHDWVCVVSKRDLDWALEAVDLSAYVVSIAARNLEVDVYYLLLEARWYVSCFLMSGINSFVVQPLAWKSS